MACTLVAVELGIPMSYFARLVKLCMGRSRKVAYRLYGMAARRGGSWIFFSARLPIERRRSPLFPSPTESRS